MQKAMYVYEFRYINQPICESRSMNKVKFT